MYEKKSLKIVANGVVLREVNAFALQKIRIN